MIVASVSHGTATESRPAATALHGEVVTRRAISATGIAAAAKNTPLSARAARIATSPSKTQNSGETTNEYSRAAPREVFSVIAPNGKSFASWTAANL